MLKPRKAGPFVFHEGRLRGFLPTPTDALLAAVAMQMFDHPEGEPLPQLTYVGCLVCDNRSLAVALGEEAVRLAGLPPSTLVDLWEQASHTRFGVETNA